MIEEDKAIQAAVLASLDVGIMIVERKYKKK